MNNVAAGVYTVTVTDNIGVEVQSNVVTITDVVSPDYSTSESVSVCSGSSYTFPDQTTQTNITSQVVYTSNLQTVSGCDSIIETTVNVTSVNVGTNLNGATISAMESGASYEWFDCNNNPNVPISGATGQSYTPTVSGLYAVEVTVNGCTDRSGCVSVSFITDDDCSGANDINSLFGGPLNTPVVSSLYDNTGYTSAGDPTSGYECFFLGDGLQSTVWYNFTGDGNTYRIRSILCNATDGLTDTQVAAYSGDCNGLTPVACNEDEDEPNSVYNIQLDLETTNGTEYYLMIDGYGGSTGEFCLEVTHIDNPVGIVNVEEKRISVYPNPTEGVVSWNATNVNTAEVYDNTGRLVLTDDQPNGTLDIHSLKEGIYTLMLLSETGVYTTRVFKQ